MARHPRGTTPKLTSELIDEIAAAVRNGCYLETATALVGISRDTLHRWLRQAQDEDAPDLIKELSDTVKKALAESEARDLAVIDKAAQDGVWQAAAWRLERKHADRWGRQSKVQLEHSGPDGKAIEVAAVRENLKAVLADPDALTALETLEAKLVRPENDEND